MDTSAPPRTTKSPKVVVVGPCASGKSTLVANLKDKGIEAKVCGQEHSAIKNLWAKMVPDILIALNVDLETLRARRHPSWPESLYDVQQARLHGAFEAAHALIDTTTASEEETLQQALIAVARFEFS